MRTKLLNSLRLDQIAELVNDMREWLVDEKDLGQHEVDAMNDNELLLEINRFYIGGIDSFILDNDIIDEQAPPHGSLYGEPCGDRY